MLGVQLLVFGLLGIVYATQYYNVEMKCFSPWSRCLLFARVLKQSLIILN